MKRCLRKKNHASSPKNVRRPIQNNLSRTSLTTTQPQLLKKPQQISTTPPTFSPSIYCTLTSFSHPPNWLSSIVTKVLFFFPTISHKPHVILNILTPPLNSTHFPQHPQNLNTRAASLPTHNGSYFIVSVITGQSTRTSTHTHTFFLQLSLYCEMKK